MRRDNKTLVEELLESSSFYFGTIIQEVENARRCDFDAEGAMSDKEGKEITHGQERGGGERRRLVDFPPSLRRRRGETSSLCIFDTVRDGRDFRALW